MWARIILWIVRNIIIPLVIIIVFVVLAPKAEWTPGTSYDEWFGSLSGCDVGDESCKPDIGKVCWACPMLSAIFDLVSHAGARMFIGIADACITIMGIGLALWILFKMGSIYVSNINISSQGEQLDFKFFKTFGYTLAKATVVAAILGMYGNTGEMMQFLFQNTIAPIIEFGTTLATHMVGASDCGVFGDSSMSGVTSTLMTDLGIDSGEHLLGVFNSGMKEDLYCLLSTYNIHFIGGVSAGYNLFMVSLENWQLIDLFGGIMIMAIFAIALFQISFYFIDILITLGVIVAVSPLLLVSWVFKDIIKGGFAKSFIGNPFSPFKMVWSAMVYFIVFSFILVVFYQMFVLVGDLYYPATPGGGTAFDGFTYLFPDFLSSNRDSFSIPSLYEDCQTLNCFYKRSEVQGLTVNLLPLIVVGYIAFLILKNVDNYISWAGGSKDGLGFGIGDKVLSGVKQFGSKVVNVSRSGIKRIFKKR